MLFINYASTGMHDININRDSPLYHFLNTNTKSTMAYQNNLWLGVMNSQVCRDGSHDNKVTTVCCHQPEKINICHAHP